MKQVCVQPPPSAVNVTLLAFAAKRRCLLHGARSVPAAIDRYLLPAGRLAANPSHAAVAVSRWDRHTDGQTDGRPTVTQTLFDILCGQRQYDESP